MDGSLALRSDQPLEPPRRRSSGLLSAAALLLRLRPVEAAVVLVVIAALRPRGLQLRSVEALLAVVGLVPGPELVYAALPEAGIRTWLYSF